MFGHAQRRGTARRVREPATRLQLDVRHQPADRRLRGRAARLARTDQRRHRPVPEPAELAAHRRGGRSDRTSVGGAAAELHRQRGARRRTGRTISARPGTIPTHVRRRRVDVLEHRAERLALRARLHAAAQLAREPQLEHADPRQSVPVDERRDVFAEPQSAESDRPELRSGRALHAAGREPSGVRESGEHLPDDRRDPVARRARHAELRAGHRLPLRPAVAQHAAQPRLRAGRVQLGVPVERDVRLAEGRRQDARLRRRIDRRRSVRTRSGRAAIAMRAIRSPTTSATRSTRR